jgi:GMP synthase (glutamine-hydrolysing)
MSHGDSVVELPPGFEVVGSSKSVQFTAVQNLNQKLYGVQFHPEVDHTEQGLEILQFFAVKVCREKLQPFVLNPDKIVAEIKAKVGQSKVICAVSGGVDSTVAAFLIGKAVGKQLIPVYVESGLMRDGTLEHVQNIFTHQVHADLVVVHARERFMAALQDVTDPEVKRKAIGKLYVDIFQEQAEQHRDAKFLGQGTIYSDVIESKGSKHASKIKSHHNVGGLPADMKLELLEPVRNYYKDEVRELGRLAGLPEELVMQQPFPGPGYAIRVRGEVTEARLAQVKLADQIVIEEVTKAGLYQKVFQCFAVMTGAFSTAVKGDARAFAEVVAVRAYESKDVMTSQWAQLPFEVLQKISSRIVNEVPNVSRVVYDITTKPPATMEWE